MTLASLLETVHRTVGLVRVAQAVVDKVNKETKSLSLGRRRDPNGETVELVASEA